MANGNGTKSRPLDPADPARCRGVHDVPGRGRRPAGAGLPGRRHQADLPAAGDRRPARLAARAGRLGAARRRRREEGRGTRARSRRWARDEKNPVGGWYGLRKGYRGRFGMYLPPLLEALGLAELTHDARNNRIRAHRADILRSSGSTRCRRRASRTSTPAPTSRSRTRSEVAKSFASRAAAAQPRAARSTNGATRSRRVGGAALGQLAEPHHQGAQHPARLVGVVALQGVGLPVGQRLLEPEHRGDAAVDVASRQRRVEVGARPVGLGPQRQRRPAARRRPSRRRPTGPAARPRRRHRPARRAASRTASSSPSDSPAAKVRVSPRRRTLIDAVAGNRDRARLDVDDDCGVLVDAEDADVVGQLRPRAPRAGPRRGSRTGCRGSRPPCCRSAGPRPRRHRSACRAGRGPRPTPGPAPTL